MGVEERVTVTEIILERLGRIEAKLDLIQQSGCSKAAEHDVLRGQTATLFDRLNSVEKAQAEGKGRVAVIAALVALVGSWLLEMIGRRL